MTNEFYTTLEDSRLVAPIMERLGIEADAWYDQASDYRLTTEALARCHGPNYTTLLRERGMSSYRLDKLLLALPEWCIGWTAFPTWQDLDFVFIDPLTKVRKPILTRDDELDRIRLTYYIQTIMKERGPEALHACVELLVLLDEGKLL